MLRGIQNATRNWLGRIVLGVLLGLIAISFAIWGVGDMFRGFGESTVAKVGGSEIRIESFRQIYQDRISQISRQVGRPITPDQARALGLDRQILGQIVTETAVDARARSLGLGIDNAEVARRITEEPSFRGLTGQFDRTRFEQVIRQAGFTEARFVNEQRRTMIRQQLVGTVAGDLRVPNVAVGVFHRYQNEERAIDFLVLGPANAGEIGEPTPEVLAKYFEERKALFRAPEYRRLVVVPLTAEHLATQIEVSDDDVKLAYEAGKARFSTPERRRVQQIVFPNRGEAQAARDKITQGASFAEIAAARGLKEADFDLGTVSRAQMVDSGIADAAFALKEGEVSGPVDGRFGVALVNVVNVEAESVRPFAEIASEVRRELAISRARNRIADVHDKVEDGRLDGQALADVAKKIGLPVHTIEAIDRAGRTPDGKEIPDIPQRQELLTAAFDAEVGLENEPLTIPGGGYVWYDVTSVTPARERTLDEVRNQVIERWRNEQIASQLRSKSDSMVEKLRAGASLAEVAAAEKVQTQWLPGLKRSAPAKAIPARAIEQVFRTPRGEPGTSEGASPTERIVFRVNEVTVPQFNAQSAEARQLADSLRNAVAEELLAQYVSRVQQEVGVTINQSALNQVVGGPRN